MHIYTRASLAHLPWPDHADGAYARSILSAFVNEGPAAYIDNARAELHLLSAEDQVFPIILSNSDVTEPNSYVCSPSAHYIDYTLREIELELHNQPHLRAVANPAVHTLGRVLKSFDFERVVYFNNWLVSTNLFPAFDWSQAERLRKFITARYPDRALMVRSINMELNQTIFTALLDAGFIPIFSRQVYILDPSTGAHHQKKQVKFDRILERRTQPTWRLLTSADSRLGPRIRELYDSLYLDKYSRLNPRFNGRFFQACLDHGWVTLHGMFLNDQLMGVAGYFARDGVMTPPIVGYDRSRPQKEGLYRLVMLKLSDEAERLGYILNCSSGAAEFKRHRGCVPSTEYNLVYCGHLPRHRQWPWKLLAQLTRGVLVPLMQKLEL